MGWVKNKMMEMQDNGDWPSRDLADKYVCTCHFQDKYLNGIIESHGKQGTCSYCGKQHTVCDMYTLCEQIVWKIGLYFNSLDDAGLYLANGVYDDEQEVIPGFKRIGEYVVPDGLTYYDSVEELMDGLDLTTDDDDLNDDIKSCFSTEQWISSDIYDEDRSVKYANQWDRFVDTVKHLSRFTFLATPEFKNIIQEKEGHSDDILSVLRDLIIEQGLVKTLAKGTKLYRARKVDDVNIVYKFADITSPPNKLAFPNRMSPAGISMFYASFEKETATNECVGGDSAGLIVGTFETAKDLRVIDLTTIPEQSFWVNNWQENQFLHHFNENITKKVDPKDTNHLQYIPTQVFTEFLRCMFKDSKGHQIDGLIYGSSKTLEKNIVLFCNQKDSENFVDKNVKIEKFERTVGWKSIGIITHNHGTKQHPT